MYMLVIVEYIKTHIVVLWFAVYSVSILARRRHHGCFRARVSIVGLRPICVIQCHQSKGSGNFCCWVYFNVFGAKFFKRACMRQRIVESIPVTLADWLFRCSCPAWKKCLVQWWRSLGIPIIDHARTEVRFFSLVFSKPSERKFLTIRRVLRLL